MTCLRVHYRLEFDGFKQLTPEQHHAITGAWVNDCNPKRVAKNLGLPQALVIAYYGIMFMESYDDVNQWFMDSAETEFNNEHC